VGGVEVMALRPLQRRLVRVSFLFVDFVFTMDSGLLFCMPLHGCQGWMGPVMKVWSVYSGSV